MTSRTVPMIATDLASDHAPGHAQRCCPDDEPVSLLQPGQPMAHSIDALDLISMYVRPQCERNLAVVSHLDSRLLERAHNTEQLRRYCRDSPFERLAIAKFFHHPLRKCKERRFSALQTQSPAVNPHRGRIRSFCPAHCEQHREIQNILGVDGERPAWLPYRPSLIREAIPSPRLVCRSDEAKVAARITMDFAVLRGECGAPIWRDPCRAVVASTRRENLGTVGNAQEFVAAICDKERRLP